MSTKQHLHALTQCALLCALGAVLAQIKLYDLPLGGSITLCSMLPILLAGQRFGALWGFGTAFVFSVIQLLTGLSSVAYLPTAGGVILCILLDYLLAFTVLGMTGLPLFRRRGLGGFLAGSACACLCRFLAHFLSGAVVWYSITRAEQWNDLVMKCGMWTYSFIYNISYMGPEILLTLLAAPLLYAALKKVEPGR